jgi:CheY-like chemotaxis protein
MTVDAAGLILHVEDERPVREAVAMLLRADGYVVNSATSGPEALQLASGGLHPDVLIVDFTLDEEMNGAEVAEKIRRILGYTPPIIMMTGDLSNAEVPCITEAPIWLTRKPLNPALLLAALPGLIQVSRATRGVLVRSAPRASVVQ